MSILALDITVQDAQGNALSGASVYVCTQPANTSTLPPSPLATVYADSTGTAGTNPLTTDGFGYCQPYLSSTAAPFTLVINHPLFLTPLVYLDQYPPGSSAASSITPVQASTTAGTITGTIDGTNRTYTLPSTPRSGSLVLDWNGQVLTPGLGYTISAATITVATALTTGDNLNANYLL